MKLYFLGVGEAFDEKLSNSHFVLETRKHSKLLIDCGYQAPRNIWRTFPQADAIDCIYLTHWHADHSLGIPALLTRWMEEGRSKELLICGQDGTEGYIQNLFSLAYPTIFARLMQGKPYQLVFREGEERIQLPAFDLRLAASSHPQKNLAVRVNVSEGNVEKSICFSGDGNFTPETKMLFQAVDVLVHDTYHETPQGRGHSSLEEVLLYAKEARVRKTALVHLQREFRQKKGLSLPRELPETVFLPEEGEIWLC
ncbi:MAG: MBL fold metallo-hydrolase [Spirochaetota bacterium]